MKPLYFETSCWPHRKCPGPKGHQCETPALGGLKDKDLGLLYLRVEGGGVRLPGGDLGPLTTPAFTFFDPNDPACQEILFDPQTTIPELFAIVRQWVPQVQHKIDVIGNEVRTLVMQGRRGRGPSRVWVTLPGPRHP